MSPVRTYSIPCSTRSCAQRLMCGLTLVLVPRIVYGGLTVLNVITNGMLGTPGPGICRDLRSHSTARATHMPEFSHCSHSSFNSPSTAHLPPVPCLADSSKRHCGRNPGVWRIFCSGARAVSAFPALCRRGFGDNGNADNRCRSDSFVLK
jgi:hypothetical protein